MENSRMHSGLLIRSTDNTDQPDRGRAILGKEAAAEKSQKSD